MSHFTTIATEFVSQSYLLAALKDVGFGTVDVHDVPVPLRGYLGDKRAQVAHLVIERKYVGAASNDIGFVRQDDGRFVAVISEFDRRTYDAKWMGRLRQRYALHASTDRLTAQGFEVMDQVVGKDSSISILLRRIS